MISIVLGGLLSVVSSVRKWSSISVWFLVVFALFSSIQDTTQGWGNYHYYIGSKYFSEIGYFDLYECTLSTPAPRRDLLTYNYRFDAPTCRASFSPPRWREFKTDIKAVGFYPEALADKGFNGTPFYLAISQALIIGGIAYPSSLWVFDVLALSIAGIVLVWSVGFYRAGLIIIFVLTFYGTTNRLWGHFLQWLWLSLAIVGASLINKNKPWGGVLLGLSSALAIFPVFLMPFYWKQKSVLLFALLGLIAGLGVGLGNSRGVNGYIEFIDNMSIHSSYVKTELCCGIGLSQALTWTANPGFDYLVCFNDVTLCKPEYNYNFDPLFYMLLLPIVMISPVGLMFGLLTLSEYYYLILAVTAIWYGQSYTRLLLFINGSILLWMYSDFYTAIINRNWVWFAFISAWGAYYVGKYFETFVQTGKLGIYTKITARYVSRKI